MRHRQNITFRCFPLFLLVMLFPAATLAQIRPTEAILRENNWLKTHHYILRLTSDSSLDVGELRMLEESSTHKYPTACFDGLPKNKGDEYTVFQETSQVWKRSKLAAVVDAIKAKIDFPKPTKESGGGLRPNIEVILNPSKGAASIIAILSFRGTREDVDSETLLSHVLKSNWSDDCLSAVRNKNSFLVMHIIRGSLKFRFAQVIDGVAKPIEQVVTSDWKKIGEGNDVAYETDAILVLARHLNIKTKGSRVTWMKVTTNYLTTLD